VHLDGMRYVSLVMALLFSLFTYWQLNDLNQYHTEKWYLWVGAYALCALISVVSFFMRLPVAIYLSMAAAALAAGVIRIQGVEWSKKVLYNTENPSGNETGGLLIVVIWMVILAFRRRTSTKPQIDR